MAYYIFNNKNGYQRAGEYQSDISEEILFKGSKEEFEGLGFTESELGGFELKEGKLVFSIEKKAQYEAWKKEQEKPLASGKGLKQFLNEQKTAMTDEQLITLFDELNSLYNTLDQGRYNPISEAQLNFLVTFIQSKFPSQLSTILVALIGKWKEGVRFE
jgi:hypothetical protein